MKKEVFLIAISASIALGANNQKDLDLINASAAYDQGITGSGVKIGVIDGPARDDVNLLQGKVNDQMFSKYKGSTYKPDYTVDTHGTHVTSIIVGKKLRDDAPHGVAYGATSYNLQVTGRNTTGSNSDIEVPSPDKIYSYFMNNGVSVINNSWNSKIYPLVGMDGEMTYHPLYISTEANSWIEQAFYKSKEIQSLVQISEENKALVVFAAGNEGMSSPGLFATLPSYNEKLRSFLVVGAVDSDKITKNGDELELKGVSVPLFSNGFKGSINYALMAPGNNVVAANAAYGLRDVLGKIDKNEFIAISGTSQATPYVSGVAALVKEKFPFLKPSQIADVLLSTANQNFTKPKVILKKTTIGEGLKEKIYYTVFYLDNDIPMLNGQVDTAQVEKDLRAEGYNDWREYWLPVQPSNTNQFKDPEYKWIQKVSWQEVFGQGILDIGKAMGGIGKLDANRMSDKDIDSENSKQALYTLNIEKNHGQVIFSNNISQRLWEDNTHEKDAVSKPIKLPNVTQIGIKKDGDGTLLLSGNSDYKGDTIINNGELILSGKLISSSVFAKNSSIFTLQQGTVNNNVNISNNAMLRGIGKIEGNLINYGIVRAGFYDDKDSSSSLDTLRVGGEYSQRGSNAILQIAFAKSDLNSKFIAKNYDIQDGGLQYVPLHNVDNLIQKGETITVNLDDGLVQQFGNFKISALSTNLLAFDMQEDGKSFIARERNGNEQGRGLDKGQVKQPTPTPPDGGDSSGGADGTGTGGSQGGGSSGSGSQGGSGNTPTNPSQPAQPTQPSTPTQPSQPTQPEEQPNQPQNPSGNTGDNNQNNNTGAGNQNQNNRNQNQNNQAEQIAAQQIAGQQAVAAAVLAAAPVAPSSPDAPIKALQSLLESAATLSPQSTAALAQLDNLPSEQFSDAINAMKNTPTNTNIDSIDTMQKDLTIKNALFLMDPASSLGSLNTSSSVFAPTAAFGDEYLGKIDDVFIKTELSAGIAYRHTDHDNYKQNSYLLDLQAKKALSDSTLLGGFIGLSNSKTEDDLSDTRSNMFSLGLSLNHNFDSFGVLLGASAGMSFNRYEQSIKYLSNAKSDANYKNYFANFQGGVYKSFKLSENLNFTPIALLDYSVIRQDSFSQSGALAKNYEAKTTHFGRGWLGANLVYNTELNNNWRFNASLFAFYWRKFNNKDINQNLSFVEASNQKFLANTSRSEKQGFYGGVAFGASKGNKFFRISISDEKARAYNQYEIMLRAGISF